MTTRLVGHYEGLERFFAADWPMAQEELIAGSSAALESHIEELSATYGYPVLYNQETFQQTTQMLLSQRNLPAASGFATLYAVSTRNHRSQTSCSARPWRRRATERTARRRSTRPSPSTRGTPGLNSSRCTAS